MNSRRPRNDPIVSGRTVRLFKDACVLELVRIDLTRQTNVGKREDLRDFNRTSPVKVNVGKLFKRSIA